MRQCEQIGACDSNVLYFSVLFIFNGENVHMGAGCHVVSFVVKLQAGKTDESVKPG